jgi:hypothetical protein
MTIEAYSVAVNIKLVENVTRGLAMMSRHFKTTDAEAAVLEARLKAIGKLTLAGGLLAGAGLFGLRMFKGPIEEAKKYQVEIARISSLNLGAGVTEHADKFARAANVIGNSARQMAAHYGDALAVFKSAKDADMVAPILGKMQFANGALYSESGAGRDKALMDLMKVIEFRGGTRSDAEFMSQADMAQRIINASRGRVDGAQMLQAMKSGGLLAKQMSNKAFYLAGEPLIQEMGGFRFGTGLNAVYSNLAQGRGSITAQQEMLRLGLLDKSKVEFNNQGRLKKALPGAFTGMDSLMAGGPAELLDKVLLPAFARAGITDPKGVQQEIGMIFSNSRAAALVGTAYQQRQKLAMQTSANAKAMGIDRTVGVAAKTASGQEIDLLAKEATLKMQIGQAILPLYVKMLEKLRDTLQVISAFATNHPQMFKGMIEIFAALSALAMVSGGLMLITAAFRALAIVGPALAVAGRAFALIKWAEMAPGLLMVGRAFLSVGWAFLASVGEGLLILGSDLLALGGILLANPVGLILVAIGVAAYELWKHWDYVGPKLKACLNAVYSGVLWMINGVIGLLNHLPGVAIGKIGGSPGVPQNTVRPGDWQRAAQSGVYLNGYLVGKYIAPSVTKHQTAAASRPNSSGNAFNGAMSPMHANFVGR